MNPRTGRGTEEMLDRPGLSASDVKNFIYSELDEIIVKNELIGTVDVGDTRTVLWIMPFWAPTHESNPLYNVRSFTGGQEGRVNGLRLTKEEVWAKFLEAFPEAAVGGRRRRRSTRKHRYKRRGSRK